MDGWLVDGAWWMAEWWRVVVLWRMMDVGWLIVGGGLPLHSPYERLCREALAGGRWTAAIAAFVEQDTREAARGRIACFTCLRRIQVPASTAVATAGLLNETTVPVSTLTTAAANAPAAAADSGDATATSGAAAVVALVRFGRRLQIVC